MSDVQKGPGGWQASDGMWCPAQPLAGSVPEKTAGKGPASLAGAISSFVVWPAMAKVVALEEGSAGGPAPAQTYMDPWR